MTDTSTQIREQAALLVAEARLDYAQIAQACGVEVRTLHRWRKEKRFAARVRSLAEELADASRRRAIGRKEYRTNTLANLHDRCLRVIEERAKDPALATIPGGSTGLIVRQVREIGHGEARRLIPEYVVDTALIRTIGTLQEQAAKELGQFVERRELKFTSLKEMTDEQLRELHATLIAGGDASGSSGTGRKGTIQ